MSYAIKLSSTSLILFTQKKKKKKKRGRRRRREAIVKPWNTLIPCVLEDFLSLFANYSLNNFCPAINSVHSYNCQTYYRREKKKVKNKLMETH